MSVIQKILQNLSVLRDADGNLIVNKLSASAVVMSDGSTSLEDKLSADSTATSTALSTAINALKDGSDGTTLAEDYNTLKKLSDLLVSYNTTLNTFLSGEDNDNETMDRLSELVAAINANAGTIDALTSGKVATTDIVNDLTTGGTAKVLSAEQGKTLKGLIDTINTTLTSLSSSNHSHDNATALAAITTNHTLLATKIVTEVPETWPTDVRTDGVLFVTSA
ncbi:MAG: hypothetical protein R3Y11_12590 [Pseudomonadota bacterium]